MSVYDLLHTNGPWAKLFCEDMNIRSNLHLDSVTPNQVLVSDGSKNTSSVPFSTFQGSPVTPFSVGIGQAFSSINACLIAAVIAGYNESNKTTVYITPGTYTEDVILVPGISLSSFNAAGATINGKMFCDINGSVEIANLTLNNTVDVIFEVAGSNSSSITFNNVVFNQFSANYTFTCSNSQVGLFFSNCSVSQNVVGDIFNISFAQALFMKNCLILAADGAIILGTITSLSIIQSNVLACKVISTNTSNINVLFGCIVVFNNSLSGGSLVTVTGGGQVGIIETVLVGQSGTDFACGGDGNPANTVLKYNTGVLSLNTTINGIPNVINLSTL